MSTLELNDNMNEFIRLLIDNDIKAISSNIEHPSPLENEGKEEYCLRVAKLITENGETHIREQLAERNIQYSEEDIKEYIDTLLSSVENGLMEMFKAANTTFGKEDKL